tara:strand:- start:1060 stop:1239 length:180 start_codon:yes stop_codon:yes gene_type:complete
MKPFRCRKYQYSIKTSKGRINMAPVTAIILLGLRATMMQIRNIKMAAKKDENSIVIFFL